MADLVGIYSCKELDAEFEITETNELSGYAKGIFKLGEVGVSVTIHHHNKTRGQSEVSLSFVANNYNPNYYTSGACYIPDALSLQKLYIAGGFASTPKTIGFSGTFIRTK